MLFNAIRLGFSGWYLGIWILASAVAFLCAIILHEVAHAWTAYKNGDPSAKIAGRISLNPAKHLDPMGTLFLVFFPFGWAKPVPVNPFNYRNFRRGNFWVSIAGVTVNLILGFVFSLFLYMMIRFDADINNFGFFALYSFLSSMVMINIALMFFNLLPIYPLDGYNVLVSFTKPNNKYMQFVRQYSMFVFFGVLLLLSYTGFLWSAINGVINGFMWFWGLIF